MSQETSEWLNQNTLIGFTDKRGHAWHYRAGADNHWPGAVPLEVVRKRLFHWTPEEAPISVTLPNGKVVADPTRKAIVRPDTEAVLGIFRPSYQVHGYEQWLVREVENILDDGDLHIGSAGLLKGGAVAWVQFELEETMTVAGVDFRPFFTSATSLDGSLATTYVRGVQLVVCDNTLAGALVDKSQQAKIKHTARSLTNLGEIRDKVGVVFETAEDAMAEIDMLAHQPVADRIWQKFLDQVAAVDPKASVRSRNMATAKREALEHLYAHDERVSPWAGSAYGVVVAMNTYEQHVQHVRNMSRPERNMLNMVKGGFEKSDAETLRVLASVS